VIFLLTGFKKIF